MNKRRPFPTIDWRNLEIERGSNVPHWTCDRAIYHVSFRLADSLPINVLNQWRRQRRDIVQTAKVMGRELTDHENLLLKNLFSKRIEAYLDAGHGTCLLANPAAAEIVSNSLAHFDGDRYALHAWCVMPSHVHAVVEPFEGHALREVVHGWTSFTSNEINKTLSRSGKLWQHEPYDHLIRSWREYRFQLNYVCDNPKKAGLRNWKWCWRTPEIAWDNSI